MLFFFFLRPVAKSLNTRNIPSPANREVIKVKNPDGSEKVSVSIATETEWSWLESVRLVGKLDEKDSLTGGRFCAGVGERGSKVGGLRVYTTIYVREAASGKSLSQL